MNWKGWCKVLVLLGVASGCAPSRYVRPLAEGEVAVKATYGGPVFQNFGAPIPAPLISVGGAYGVKEGTTVYGDFHVTSATFGTLQLDLGVTQGFLRPEGWRPGISGSGSLNFAVDVWEGGFKVWPQIDANAYWEYGDRRHFFYSGVSTWWEVGAFAAPAVDNADFILPGLQIGNTLAGKSWDKTLELKWSHFTRSSRDAVVDWMGVGGYGAVGVFVGITKRF